jgi:hypothetical protein
MMNGQTMKKEFVSTAVQIIRRTQMRTKTIEYKGKKIKLPFAVALSDEPTSLTTINNRFGGESCELPEFAAAVYDVIIGSEVFKQWDSHRKGLDWFIKYFPKEYGVLLD